MYSYGSDPATSTSQGVPPDEHPWIEQFGCTRTYRALRNAIRDYYRTWYPLTDEARGRPDLNPGEGRVSRLCHEPRVAAAVLDAMLAPYAAGRLRPAHPPQHRRGSDLEPVGGRRVLGER